MHSPNQYVAAALHSGTIDPQLVIDRLEDTHRAPLIEIGLDPSYILQEARRARSRKWTRDFLLLIPAFPIIGGLIEYLSHSYVDLEDVIGPMFPFLFLATVIAFVHQILTNGYVKNLISAETPNPPNTSGHNVVVSGGYSPFAGYGFDLDSWSFTVDTTKPSPGKENRWTASSATELLDYVSRAVVSNIALATYEDKIFVNGRDIRHNQNILDNPIVTPRTSISEEAVRDRIGQTDERIRHYRVISIPIWAGHLQLSIFLRFAISGANLFAEARYFLLTPLQEQLMDLDNAPLRRGAHYYWGLFVVSALKSIIVWIRGPLLLLHWIGNIQNEIAKAIFGDPEDKLKVRSSTYNYGHAVSLREAWSTPKYHRYFQMLDKDMTYKVSQHIVMNSIVDFLESKGVSTDDVKERRTTIFNTGVIVSGGTINADHMAVGKGAAIKTKVAQAFRPNTVEVR